MIKLCIIQQRLNKEIVKVKKTQIKYVNQHYNLILKYKIDDCVYILSKYIKIKQ